MSLLEGARFPMDLPPGPPPIAGDCLPFFKAADLVLEAAGALRPLYQEYADQLRERSFSLSRQGWEMHRLRCEASGIKPEHPAGTLDPQAR